MADERDAVEGSTLRLQLELQLDRRPISGRLLAPDGVTEWFEGWLGFADALRRVHDSSHDRPGTESPASTSTTPGSPEHHSGGSIMRKITACLFTTLDGVVEAPERWHFPYFNEEMGAVVEAQISTADTMLVGRRSYDTFAGIWPQREAAGEADAGTARKLGDARKVVVSSRTPELTWRNSEQLRGELVEAVTALKNEPGGDIAISGSVSIVRQLLEAGLLDELHLLVDPIAVRRGARLFDESTTSMPLTLLESTAFTNGVLHLVYGPVGSAPTGRYREAVQAMAQAQQG